MRILKVLLMLEVLAAILCEGTVAAEIIENGNATYFELASVSQAGSNGVIVKFLLADDNTEIVADSGELNVLIKKAEETYLDKTLKVNASDFFITTAILKPNPHPQYDTKRLILDAIPNENDEINAYLTFTTVEGNVLKEHQTFYWR